jgi:hypothetical protein
MGNSELFRAKAAEYDKLATEAGDAVAKRMLQEAADTWRVVANKAERLER